jgi:predicted permease
MTLDGFPKSVQPAGASANFLDVLGIHPEAGRWFTADDDRRGAEAVAVLSDRFWRRSFDARPDVIGRSIVLNRHSVTVIGVAPAGFRGVDIASPPDLYLPMLVVGALIDANTNLYNDGSKRESPTAWVRSIARLAKTQTSAQAEAAIRSVDPPRSTVYGLVDLETASLAEAARPSLRQFGELIAATVGLLLAIGCLAVGMQLLIRTESRREELAMSLALGAARSRVLGGVLIEGAALAGAAAIVGLPLSALFVSSVSSFQLPGRVDLAQLDTGLSAGAFGAAALAAFVATMTMAAIAGTVGLTADLSDALRARTGSTPRIGRRRLRGVLVIAEVAAALVLLTGAGLFARSLAASLTLNPGYDTARISTATIFAPPRAARPEVADAFFDEFAGKVRALPSIRAASLISSGGGMTAGGRVSIDGEWRVMPSFLRMAAIDSAYFPTIGLPIGGGRNFADSDGATASKVAIVSASFGRFLARGGDPLGHHIQATSHQNGQPYDQFEVVGVVPDIVTDVKVLEPLALYQPIAQTTNFPARSVVLRAAAASTPAIRDVETIARQEGIEPTPLFISMADQIARQMSPQRFGATVIGSLGGVAAVLTFFGVFVLADTMATLRRREMGVRAALGATASDLSRIVLREVLVLVGTGLALGLGLVWLGAGLVRALLYRVQPFDPVTLIVVTVAVGAIAAAVSLGPAIRAGRVDLANVLREE